MKTIWKLLSIWMLVSSPVLLPVVGIAEDFELFWNPNCDSNASLEGYYIYYIENASVADNLSAATQIYVPVSEDGFDRTEPSHKISNLLSDVRYCFAVSAWYGDQESGISNEVCGINVTDSAETKGDTAQDDDDQTITVDDGDTGSTIIIDDGDTGSFSSGTWKVSGGADPYGTQSLYSKDVGATYGYKASLDGRYEVAVRWTYYSSRCVEVPIEIYDGDLLLDTVTVNQKQNIGQWNVLGTYDFSGSARVVIVSESGNCTTCADAASFHPVEADAEPETTPDDENQTIIIDDGDIGSFTSGTWKVSGGADPYGTQSLYSRDAGAAYSYKASLAGRYEVAVRWTYYSSRCVEVPIEIYDGDLLLDTVTVNQKQNVGQWNLLGTYDFSGSARVVIVSESENCTTCADAASFHPVEADAEPETAPDGESQTIIIDDGDIGSFSSGTWKVSGGADPYAAQSFYSRDAGAAYSYEASLAGRYDVAMRWTYYASRCVEVPIEIYDGDLLLDTVTVNQKQNSGQWNILGTYDFSGSARVVIVSESGNCTTCADAVLYQN